MDEERTLNGRRSDVVTEPIQRSPWSAPRLERLDFDGTDQGKGTASTELKEFYSGGVTS